MEHNQVRVSYRVSIRADLNNNDKYLNKKPTNKQVIETKLSNF